MTRGGWVGGQKVSFADEDGKEGKEQIRDGGRTMH